MAHSPSVLPSVADASPMNAHPQNHDAPNAQAHVHGPLAPCSQVCLARRLARPPEQWQTDTMLLPSL
eukprot:6326096-Amphidinium_carterae.1